jgi:hypothetical protein
MPHSTRKAGVRNLAAAIGISYQRATQLCVALGLSHREVLLMRDCLNHPRRDLHGREIRSLRVAGGCDQRLGSRGGEIRHLGIKNSLDQTNGIAESCVWKLAVWHGPDLARRSVHISDPGHRALLQFHAWSEVDDLYVPLFHAAVEALGYDDGFVEFGSDLAQPGLAGAHS